MNMAGFGRVVRDHRERLHLTQEELAARGGPSTTTLTKVEAGEGRIHRKTAGDVSRDEFDLDAIADEAVEMVEGPYYRLAGVDEFWAIVEKHAI